MILSLAQRLESFFHEHSSFLLSQYPGLSLNRFFQELEEFLHLDRSDFDRCFGLSHVQDLEERFSFYLEEVKRGVPLEYIVKRRFFYRSLFYVDSRVLIPRSETEILVELAVKEIQRLKGSQKKEDVPAIVDVGTGSGAIVLSVLSDLNFPVSAKAIDLSLAALQVAKMNYFTHQFSLHPQTQLEFLEGDRFSPFKNQLHLFDIIVSNPPYIKEVEDRESVHPQVASYEPSMALYLKDEEYENWYQEFFQDAFRLLKDEGVLFMEGHEKHLKNLQCLLENAGFSLVSIQEDYTKRPRFLIARKRNYHG